MKFLLSSFVSLSFMGMGCSPSHDASSASKSNKDLILTTFYPTTYFAESISGDLVPVECPVPNTEDPIHWQPSRSSILKYQSASLIILNGAYFEKWVGRVNLPLSRVIEGLKLSSEDLIHYEGTAEHRHGPAGTHAHEGIDGHTWLDPLNAKEASHNIFQAMCARWPKYRDEFSKNYTKLEAGLDALHVRMDAIEMPPAFASHPAYNYLARRYGWNIKNLDLIPNEILSEDQIKIIGSYAKQKPTRLLLWESKPLAKNIEELETRLDISSVIFSPCEMISQGSNQEESDYLSRMNQNIDRLVSVIDSDGTGQ
ncbi:MAG: zinc ABC transporter substrate-binding protein [Verrucomicrobiota bacterium]|nr:zinc ABC transporter substrate-binding protein [Verrucomicrobiota bacterium]